MNITATDVAAWWGGITGSILFVIEMLRYTRERPGFAVDVDYEYDDEYLMRDRPTVLRYTIRNTSDKSTTITQIRMTAWLKHPHKWKSLRYDFFASGVLDETKGINYPQKLEPGDHIQGMIDAKTIREHAPKSARPVVLCIYDTLHNKPKRIRLDIPERFLAPMKPFDKMWNQIRAHGTPDQCNPFVSELAKAIGVQKMKLQSDPSGTCHIAFPCAAPVEEQVVRATAAKHGIPLKGVNLNVRLEG